jgi:hypothetical protein
LSFPKEQEITSHRYSNYLCPLWFRLGKRRRLDLAEPSTSSAVPEEPRFSLEPKEENPRLPPVASAARPDDVGITMNFVEALLR